MLFTKLMHSNGHTGQTKLTTQITCQGEIFLGAEFRIKLNKEVLLLMADAAHIGILAASITVTCM